MKNIDQNTPFLAFYDLLRIRGVYSEPEKREKLRRGFRRAMALAATVLAFALPQGARAGANLPVPDGWEADWNADATEINLSHDTRNWTDFSIGSGYTVNFTGTGTAVNKVTGEDVSEILGTLTGDKVYILNPNGILFGSDAVVDVNGLVAAAMGSFSFGSDLNASDVKGTVTANGVKGDSFTVLIGTSVSGAADGATVVATSGMSEGATFNLSSADNGATITFVGETGAGSVLKASNVVFGDNVTIGGGDVNASTGISGSDFKQTDGNVETAGTVDAKVTQTGGELVAKTVKEVDQTAGTITVESVTGAAKVSGTLNGVADKGLTVGSLELGSAASVDAKGSLVIQGAGTLDGTVTADSVSASGQTLTFKSNAGLSDTSVTAGTVALDAGVEDIALNSLTADKLQGTAGNVTVANTKALDVAGLTATAAEEGAEANVSVSAAGKLTVSDAVSAAAGTVSLGSTGNALVVSKDVTGKSVGLTAKNYVNVDSGATVRATADDGNVTVASSGGNVNVNGALVSDKGNVEVTIGEDGSAKSVKIGTTGSVTATEGSVTLGGGKSVQIGGAVEAGTTVGVSAAEYVGIAANVTAKDGVSIQTTEKDVLSAAVGGFEAGSAAGIIVQSGTVKATAGSVEMVSKGSIATLAGSTIEAVGGNVTLTAAGENTESVTQGIQLAGSVSATVPEDAAVDDAGNVTIEAAKGVVSVDTVTADNAVAVTAGDALSAATEITGATVELTGKSVEGAANVKATAGNLDVTATDGKIDLTGALSAVAAEGDETGETGNVTIEAEKGAVSVDTVTADNAVAVTAGDELAAATEITGATIELTGKSVTGEAAVTVNAGEGSTLSVTATDGDIELTGAVKATVGEEGDPIATTLTAEKGAVKLENADNDFDAVTAKGKSVALQDANAVVLTKVDATAGDATVTAKGKITATDVTSSGKTTLTGVGVDAATVDAGGALKIDAGTGDLKVGTAVSGSSVELSGKSVTGAGTVTADSSTLKATASDGDVALTGVVKATGGAATLTAEKGDVSLENAGNDFKSVTAKAKDVALKDANAVTLTKVDATAGDATVTAKGKITATDVTSSGKTTLTGVGVDAATVDAEGALKIDAGTGDLKVGTAVSGSSVELSGKSVTGAGSVTADRSTLKATASDGDVALTGVVKATGGEATFTAEKGNVKLDNGGNDLDSVTAEAKKDILVKDQNALELKKAKSSSGDVRAIAGETLQVNGAVTASSGNVLLEGGGVTVDAAVSGKNVTVSDTGSSGVTISAGVEADEDLYVQSESGNVKATSSLAGNEMLVIDAQKGSITVNDVATKGTFSTHDKNGLKIEGKQDSDSSIIKTDGDYTVSDIADGTTVSVDAGGNVKLNSSGTIKIGDGKASASSSLKVTEVVEKGTKETSISAASEGGKVSGVTAGKNATITAASVEGGTVTAKNGNATVTATSGDVKGTSVSGKTTKVESKTGSVNAGSISGSSSATVTAKKDVTASSISGGKVDVTAQGGKIDVSGNVKGGPIDLKAENGAISAGSVSGGDVTMTSKDDVTVKESLDGKNVVIKAGGNLTIDGTTTVDTLDAGLKEGSVGGDAVFSGDVEAGVVGILAGGSIKTDGATIKTTDSVSLDAKGDVNVMLDSKKIELVSGSEVNVTEKAASRDVVVNTLKASRNLTLKADAIGGADGKQGGFVDGNGDSLNFEVNGDLLLDVGGKVGTSKDPLEAKVGGTLVIKGGAMDAESVDDAFLHVVLRNSVIPKVSYPSVFGLVIVNNQIMGGSKRLIRRMNRALAFTVNTPELKSTQGVFGESAFIHTGLDVSEARSIGSVAALNLDTPDYHGIFNELLDDPDTFAKMSPAINLGADPLKTKIEAVENPSAQPDVKSFQY